MNSFSKNEQVNSISHTRTAQEQEIVFQYLSDLKNHAVDVGDVSRELYACVCVHLLLLCVYAFVLCVYICCLVNGFDMYIFGVYIFGVYVYGLFDFHEWLHVLVHMLVLYFIFFFDGHRVYIAEYLSAFQQC